MRAIMVFLSALTLACCATFSFDTARLSIVSIHSEDGSFCTAWAIAKARWITAKHCLQNAKGWTMEGVIVDTLVLDPIFDIALLSGPVGHDYMRVANEAPPIGSTVHIFGYGLNKRTLLLFPVAVVDLESEFFGQPADFLVSGANGMPGMSGGPIMYHGNVVSMITGGGQPGSPAYMLGMGVPWASLRAFTKLHLGQ